MTRTLKIGLDAEDVKDAIRAHHPAYQAPSGMPWVCLTEWMNIDLLAIDCWRDARVIGYEVKVSRGDMRAELLDPTKRAEAVSRTTQFYFAVPAGLLTPDELAFEEPEDWSFADFERGVCTNPQCTLRHRSRGWAKRLPKPRGSRLRGTDDEGVSVTFGLDKVGSGVFTEYVDSRGCCLVCRGYGRVGKSRVEQEAPTLWVPRDVGLVEVDGRGVTVVKRAPKRAAPRLMTGLDEPDEAKNIMVRRGIAQLVRWSSHYGDPRHRDAV